MFRRYFWAMFWRYVSGHVLALFFGPCSGVIFWAMFWRYFSGHVPALFFGPCSGVIFRTTSGDMFPAMSRR
jgi:hypothetical protein